MPVPTPHEREGTPSPSAKSQRFMQPYRVFSHLNADKSGLYRAVMRVFTHAKDRFSLHLRPGDLHPALDADPDEITRALQQLCEWGNLEAIPDTAEVATVDEFYRPRFLYQMTIEGEAAERAIDVFETTFRQPGELQAAALGDILGLLRDLHALARESQVDGGKVFHGLRSLRERFNDLTDRAQVFMGSLQRSIDLHNLSVSSFLAYKELLIGYLERFIGELIVSTSAIAREILAIEALDVHRLVCACADREAVDALDPHAALVESREQWTMRWQGLRSWFLGDPSHPSTAELLLARARSSIPALLNAIMTLHDRRLTRSDRWTDFRTLARWFVEAGSEEDAHRLWRGAFSLAPARHLFIDAGSLDHRTSAQTSWFQAEPVRIPLRMRQTGRHRKRGPLAAVIDRSDGKRYLAAMAEAEAQLLHQARSHIALGRRLKLSEFGQLAELNDQAFDLLLDVLGEAVASRVRPDDVVDVVTNDGQMRIVLERIRDGSRAEVRASKGRLLGDDHYILIEDLTP